MYYVIKRFADLQDKNHIYNAGDAFPREGLVVAPERLEELAGKCNKQGEPLIKKEEAPADDDGSQNSEAVSDKADILHEEAGEKSSVEDAVVKTAGKITPKK